MKDQKNPNTDVIDAAKADTAAVTPAADSSATENITGRGVFVVETVPVGVAVRTAFLAEDGRLLESPTVFPDVHYAFAQIDELKQLVAQRFAEAAQIGAQVIAQQLQANAANASAGTTAAATTTTATASPATVASNDFGNKSNNDILQ